MWQPPAAAATGILGVPRAGARAERTSFWPGSGRAADKGFEGLCGDIPFGPPVGEHVTDGDGTLLCEWVSGG